MAHLKNTHIRAQKKPENTHKKLSLSFFLNIYKFPHQWILPIISFYKLARKHNFFPLTLCWKNYWFNKHLEAQNCEKNLCETCNIYTHNMYGIILKSIFTVLKLRDSKNVKNPYFDDLWFLLRVTTSPADVFQTKSICNIAPSNFL